MQETRETIMSLEQVEKSFGSNMVLKDISVSVKKGEVVSIIGSSGGGKSTLLRCATLLETFERGRLAYGDLIVAENDSSGLLPFFVGNIIDFINKAHTKNMKLIDGYINDDPDIVHEVRRKAWISAATIVVTIAAIGAMVWFLVWLAQKLGTTLFS